MKWLLDLLPELLNAQATGHFFEPSGNVYFGGYPLMFAVSTNQWDIVQLIVDSRHMQRPEDAPPLKNSIFLVDQVLPECPFLTKLPDRHALESILHTSHFTLLHTSQTTLCTFSNTLHNLDQLHILINTHPFFDQPLHPATLQPCPGI